MERKLLVITAGTVAAGVGKEFIKQCNAHDKCELVSAVRYIDTAYLPTRYSDLRDGEWLQMSIDPRYIDNIRRNETDYEYLKPLLFKDLMPSIQGSGGGSIRYNAAGAIAIGRDRLKKWIHTGITNLIGAGDGQINLSIALVVSSVGATGSGTLERLVDIIVDAAQDAKVPSPIHCDVYILQPGWDVTDLGLANTEALYAEMAASRLTHTQLNMKSFRGRTIMVDWGSNRNMASIEQLKESAATLVRLTHDPSTPIAAEFQEREVDNHVLREQDTQSRLPSHLSTATAVTISLGDLQQRIIQRDAAQLVDMLVFGGKPVSVTDDGETIITTRSQRERPANVLMNALSGFLQGQTPDDRLAHLQLMLSNSVTLQTPQLNIGRLRNLTVRDQAARLLNSWKADKETLARSGAQQIEERGADLIKEAYNIILTTRRERMGTGLSLQQLRDDYRELHEIVQSTIRKAQEANPAGDQMLPQQVGDDQAITRRIDELGRANRFNFNKEGRLSQALKVVQNDISTIARLATTRVALDVLDMLERHSAEANRNLTIILQKLEKQRKKHEAWSAAEQELSIDMHHPLRLAALPTTAEIKTYAEQVSLFTPRKRQRNNAVARIMSGESREDDQLAAFRKWMDDADAIEALFKGDIDQVLDLAQRYAREEVDEEVKQNSVLKVLIRAGEETLRWRMEEAADKAHPMVSFSPDFATELREACHVSAYWDSEEERGMLQKAINKAFGQRSCTLLRSKDPTEIAVFYYADGLPMSAVTDLTGRCLEAFLKRRRSWHLQTEYMRNGHNGNASESVMYNQRVGVPVYSGRDAQLRVEETGVIDLVYRVRGQNVSTFTSREVPELGLPHLQTHSRRLEDEPPQDGTPAKNMRGPDGNGGNGGNGSNGYMNGNGGSTVQGNGNDNGHGSIVDNDGMPHSGSEISPAEEA